MVLQKIANIALMIQNVATISSHVLSKCTWLFAGFINNSIFAKTIPQLRIEWYGAILSCLCSSGRVGKCMSFYWLSFLTKVILITRIFDSKKNLLLLISRLEMSRQTFGIQRLFWCIYKLFPFRSVIFSIIQKQRWI